MVAAPPPEEAEAEEEPVRRPPVAPTPPGPAALLPARAGRDLAGVAVPVAAWGPEDAEEEGEWPEEEVEAGAGTRRLTRRRRWT